MTSQQNQINPVSSSEGETSKIATTIFADDAAGITVSPSVFSNDPLFENINFDGVHDLKNLVERPVRLQAGNFTTSDSGRLYNADPFQALLNVWSTKLDRAQIIKADVEVTLQVNAMRFQAGRYIVAFLPSFGHATNTTNFSAYDRMHASILGQIIQLPHVEIDLAYETSATLVLPWKSVVEAWPNQGVISAPVGFGKLILYPYYRLIPESTANTCGYTLYARFVNTVIAQPTVAQSGTEVEQKKGGIGPVSGFFSKVSKSTKILSEIPLITPYMTSLSWASAILSRAAGVFGWSKPPVLKAPELLQTRKLGYIEVSDGASTARPLGGFSTNAVQPFGVGKVPDEDEMSLSSLCSRWGLVSTVVWNTTQIAGTSVSNIAMIPANMGTAYALAVNYPPCIYPVTMFAKYRGSFKFRFKLVKNEFYSGRLGVLFQPLEQGGVGISSTADLGLAYNRVIIDVRTTREFEIVVPYSSVYTYRKVTETYGNIVLYVVDPLVCPDNMPGTVPILIEVAGADDLEYCDYTQTFAAPAAPFVVQAGEEREVFCLGKEPKPSLVPAKIAAGERFTSLRQLLKMFYFTNTYWTFDNTKTQFFNPFALWFYNQPTSIVTAYSVPEFGCDLWSLIASLYGIHLGSMRVQNFYTLASGADCTYGYGTADSAVPLQQIVTGNLFWQRGFGNTRDEHLDVIVPPFTVTAGRSLPAILASGSASVVPTGVGSTTRALLTRVWNGAVPSGNVFARQGSDDANCLHFVSTPMIVTQ